MSTSPYCTPQNGGIGEATKELLEQNALVPLAIFTDVGWSLVGLLSK